MKGHALASPAGKAVPVKAPPYSRLYSLLQVLGAVSFFAVCFISGKTQTMMSNSLARNVNNHMVRRLEGVSEDLRRMTAVTDQSSNEVQLRQVSPCNPAPCPYDDSPGTVRALLKQHTPQGELGPVAVVSIQASEGTMEILERLLGTLEHPQIGAIIHLDEKARHKDHERLQEMVLRFRYAGWALNCLTPDSHCMLLLRLSDSPS